MVSQMDESFREIIGDESGRYFTLLASRRQFSDDYLRTKCQYLISQPFQTGGRPGTTFQCERPRSDTRRHLVLRYNQYFLTTAEICAPTFV